MNIKKKFLRKYFPSFYSFLRNLYDKKQYKSWLLAGKTIPPPHIVKQMTVTEYAYRFGKSTLVETGTFQGDMIYAQKNNFKKIISIELQPLFFNNAKRLFYKYVNIELIQGDSGEVLKSLATEGKLNNPCLFWLDSHYSGGVTACGKKNTPIFEELEAILGTKQNHILLIDDARSFIGVNDYPTIDALRTFVITKFPKSNFNDVDDIIRIEIIVS